MREYATLFIGGELVRGEASSAFARESIGSFIGISSLEGLLAEHHVAMLNALAREASAAICCPVIVGCAQATPQVITQPFALGVLRQGEQLPIDSSHISAMGDNRCYKFAVAEIPCKEIGPSALIGITRSAPLRAFFAASIPVAGDGIRIDLSVVVVALHAEIDVRSEAVAAGMIAEGAPVMIIAGGAALVFSIPVAGDLIEAMEGFGRETFAAGAIAGGAPIMFIAGGAFLAAAVLIAGHILNFQTPAMVEFRREAFVAGMLAGGSPVMFIAGGAA